MMKATMSFEIGNLTLQPAAPVRPARTAATMPRPVAVPSADVVDRSDVIPASPPPEVLAEVDAAWLHTNKLAVENRELHFARDKTTGRVIIEVRTLDGEVLKTIPPSTALEVMSGGSL
jgi:hypothetical protein